MIISLIAAVGSNGVIGSENKIPWRLPADLRYFRKMTMGKPVIMGRKTYESIGKPLEGRRNIVLSRKVNLELPGCEVVNSKAQAMSNVAGVEEAMVIGGEQLYRLFMPDADRIYLTEIEADFEGDTYFPDIDLDVWSEISRFTIKVDEMFEYRYHFVVYTCSPSSLSITSMTLPCAPP